MWLREWRGQELWCWEEHAVQVGLPRVPLVALHRAHGWWLAGERVGHVAGGFLCLL